MRIIKHLSLLFPAVIFSIILAPPAFSYDLIIPDTGQELCYNWDKIICDEWHMEGYNQVCDSPSYCPSQGEDFYGQDGTYTINPPDFTDTGDGTVTDNLTLLMWEQKTEENETYSYSYADAIDYCNNLSLAGHDDWRTPTRKEYSTIFNFGRTSPALDMNYFPYFSFYNEDEVFYWTASDYYDDPSLTWRILLSFGLIDSGPKTGKLHKIRCVRGATEPAADFTDNSNGTVTDNVTGLMWEQKTDDGGSRDKDNTVTWKDALAYCEGLLLGSYSNWRLPNPKELERIVDVETSNPAIDTTYFPNTNNGLYWTGTSCSGCHKRKAFSVDFTDGELYYSNKYWNETYYENYVRCVRHPDPDGDGITYPDDSCPYISNLGQEDEDQDGVGDVCDNCLEKDNPGQGDADHDAVGDACDNCPGLYTINQDDQFPPGGNGCGDACECEGNFNADVDDDVDGSDAAVFKADFGRGGYNSPCSNGELCNGDFDCDTDIDGTDAAVFKADFGRGGYNDPCPACEGGVWCSY